MDIQLLYIDSNKGTLKQNQEFLADYFDALAFNNSFDCLPILGERFGQAILINDNFQTAANLTFFRKLNQLFPNIMKILMVSSSQTKSNFPDEIFFFFRLDFKKNGPSILKKYFDEFICKHVFSLKQTDDNRTPLIIGCHPVLMEQIKAARRISKFSENVLISGETGTGKDLFAKYIHSKSQRKDGPIHIVNCASIHPSLFEAEFFGHKRGAFTGAVEASQGHFIKADKGTLVLDEVSEIDLLSQAKLLRVIENQEFFPVGSQKLSKVNIRIIAISNKNLEDQISKGTFRKDLFHRINTFNLRLPSLRERANDIDCLVRYFINRFLSKYSQNQKIKLEENLILSIKGMEFPGNVRELESLIYKIMSQAKVKNNEIKFENVQNLITKTRDDYRINSGRLALRELLDNLRYQTIYTAFRDNNNNISRTALSLGISRQNLQYLLRKYGLNNHNLKS